MKKGDLIELEIFSYAFEGKGIAKIEKDDKKNFVIFVDHSYPGDKVLAKIIKVKSSFAEATVDKIIIPSSERTKAKCKFFGTCGGCRQQDLDYPTQLKYKHEQVKDIFERLGGFTDFELQEIIPSNNIFHYRNKMEFSFADRRWLTSEDMNKEITDSNFALGFHLLGIFSKVLDIDECFLQSELSNKILNLTRDFFKSRGTSIYSTRTHEGFLRNLVIRQSYSTNDLMVNLVASNEDDKLLTEYKDNLIKSVPRVTTVVNNINLKKAAIAVGDYEKIYFGGGTILDTIGKYRFRISANSFFQTNTLQAEKLYQTALEFAELKNDEIVYDLYSGAGTISIFISNHCKKVFAFETVESAIKDAGENNLLNNIQNVQYAKADLNKSFLEKTLSLSKPDVVILDPPRSGMSPVTVKDVASLKPKRIVYVSCNPATQVRDIKLFTEEGYKLIKIKPVDMFPHTYHIENVALLAK